LEQKVNNIVIYLELGRIRILQKKYLRQMNCDAFPKKDNTYATKFLKLIHSGVNGHMKTTSQGGGKFFVTNIDDFSRKTF
jgi:hypothetical protein